MLLRIYFIDCDGNKKECLIDFSFEYDVDTLYSFLASDCKAKTITKVEVADCHKRDALRPYNKK